MEIGFQFDSKLTAGGANKLYWYRLMSKKMSIPFILLIIIQYYLYDQKFTQEPDEKESVQEIPAGERG